MANRRGREEFDADLHAVGARVRQSRVSLGLTQTALAESAQVHQGSISEIESGRLDVRVVTLARIAAALDVPLSTFFAD